MKLEGGNNLAEMKGREQLPGKSNYIYGRDPNEWRTDISVYAKVEQKNVYDGIDLLYYGNQQQLEYDFLVAPGASPYQIKLRFDGANRIRIDSNGDLVLSTAVGELRQKKPYAYQESDGGRQEIAARYVIKGKHKVGLRVGRYDRRKTLVIDPVLIYSSYFSGVFTEGRAVAVDFAGNAYITGWTDRDEDFARGIALDAEGNAFITGGTYSLNFPLSKPFQGILKSGSLLKSDNGRIDWESKDSGLEDSFNLTREVTALAVDPHNAANVYAGTDVFGNYISTSTDGGESWSKTQVSGRVGFITVDPRSANTVYAGINRSSLLKSIDGGATWSPTGLSFNTTTVSCLVTDPENSSTLYAGTGENSFIFNLDTGRGIFKSTDGGKSWSEINNGLDWFYDNYKISFDPQSPSTLYLGTYDGVFKSLDGGNNWTATGFRESDVKALAVTKSGALYVGNAATADAFVTKLNADGKALIYSTYLGGLNNEAGAAIAVDASGSAYVAGTTRSIDFPITIDALQSVYARGGSQYPGDGFVIALDATGALTYSTFIGGNDEDAAYGLALNPRGEIYLTGQTWSGDFPTLNAFQATLAENSGFIIKLGEAAEGSIHPKITGAFVSGKKLTVTGTNFGQGAVIVLDGAEQKTINDALNPSTVLIGKRAGKKVKPGQPVVIRVKNSGGTMSDEYSFVRQ